MIELIMPKIVRDEYFDTYSERVRTHRNENEIIIINRFIIINR